MSLPLLRRLIVIAGLLLAVWIGADLANGAYFVAGLAIATLLPLVASFVVGIPPDVLGAGVLLAGYLIGNRGFAQLNIPGLPLLPGEAVLALSVAVATWRIARGQRIYFRRDSVNALMMLWIAFCVIRLPFDVRANGVIAIRDFALVYYAVFFFLAQGWTKEASWTRYLTRCLSFGFALTAPVAFLFEAWPEAVTRLTLGGVPLIFVKGDVSGAFMAAGLLWFGSRYAETGRWQQLLWFTSCGAGILLANSRAALVAACLGCMALLFLREWRIVKIIAGLGLIIALGLAVTTALPRPYGGSRLGLRLVETVLTITDLSGERTPMSADLSDKPDNNRFRLVWWKAVFDQVREEGPILGVGFGRDLAAEFLRRYYPENPDEFGARSPHNFLITVFARTGLVGLVSFAGVLIAAGLRTFRAARSNPGGGLGALWLSAWMILISACFGVVLEGPMGAAVFWFVLGLANARTAPPQGPEVEPAAILPDSAGPIESAPLTLQPSPRPPAVFR